MIFYFNNQFVYDLMKGNANYLLDNATKEFKCVLLRDGINTATINSYLEDADLVNYEALGVTPVENTVGNITYSSNTTSFGITIDQWTDINATFRYAMVLYNIGGDTKHYVLCYIDFEAEQTIVGNLNINLPTLFTIS